MPRAPSSLETPLHLLSSILVCCSMCGALPVLVSCSSPSICPLARITLLTLFHTVFEFRRSQSVLSSRHRAPGRPQKLFTSQSITERSRNRRHHCRDIAVRREWLLKFPRGAVCSRSGFDFECCRSFPPERSCSQCTRHHEGKFYVYFRGHIGPSTTNSERQWDLRDLCSIVSPAGAIFRLFYSD